MDACTSFRQIDEVTDLAESYFGDRARAIAWMITSNSDLYNEIPRILIIKGGGDRVFNLLETLSNRNKHVND